MKHYATRLDEEAGAMAFAERIKKFRDSLVPGMTLKIHEYTGDPKVDQKVLLARVIHVYKNWVLLEDDKGKKHGPTYFNLFEWGNT